MATSQVVSPLPGIFYRKPSPEASPFKEVGDEVKDDDIIGLIEVMKSFHEVKAGMSGKVAKFHVENEEAVMAGQPIMDVED